MCGESPTWGCAGARFPPRPLFHLHPPARQCPAPRTLPRGKPARSGGRTRRLSPPEVKSQRREAPPPTHTPYNGRPRAPNGRNPAPSTHLDVTGERGRGTGEPQEEQEGKAQRGAHHHPHRRRRRPNATAASAPPSAARREPPGEAPPRPARPTQSRRRGGVTSRQPPIAAPPRKAAHAPG